MRINMNQVTLVALSGIALVCAYKLVAVSVVFAGLFLFFAVLAGLAGAAIS